MGTVPESLASRPAACRVLAWELASSLEHNGAMNPGIEIPHMGAAKIADLLEKLASEVPSDTSIVEVGSWMGAGTQALARGAKASGASLHVYDIWRAAAYQVVKARGFGITLHTGEDLLPYVRKVVDPIGADVIYHKGNVTGATWDGAPISLYIDDASKQRTAWDHVTRTFFPALTNGAFVVLMDFYWCQKRGGKYLPQVRYMNTCKDFELFEEQPGGETSTALFRRRERGSNTQVEGSESRFIRVL